MTKHRMKHSSAKARQHHRGLWIALVVVVVLLVAGLIGAGNYFFQVAEVRSHKSFIHNGALKRSDPLYEQDRWFKEQPKQTWRQTTPNHLKLVANYLPAAKTTNKTVVIAHGFGGNKEKMSAYGTMFHRMGYNVLIPDDRAAGQSQGKYIGYGWLDRKDYLRWLKMVVAKNGSNSQIVMFGVSMGGATTMMVSGEHDVPKQVKAYVEDCGYTTVEAEINYQAKAMYNLPSWPLVPVVSVISQLRAGYNYREASAVKAVAHNRRPMMFIHGAKDKFVPTKMVYTLYHAANEPKQLWVVKGAGHAASFGKNPRVYQARITKFLNQYVK